MRTKLAGLFAVLIVTALLSACGGGSGGGTTDDDVCGGADKGCISGQITDVNGSGIVDSTVTLNGVVIATGNEASSAATSGWYSASDVPEGDNVLCFEADGYVKKCRTVSITGTKTTPITPTALAQRGDVISINTIENGGSATLSTAASITFPADSVCDSEGNEVTGTIDCYLTPADVTSQAGFVFAPDSFAAVDEEGNRGTMVSSAMMEITCEKSGEEVNICDGKTAEVRLPIYSATCADEPAALPGWRFDEESGVWEQYGESADFPKTCGVDEHDSYYKGDVDHMTWINGDKWVADACLTGVVYTDAAESNATTEPVTIKCWGSGWRNEVQIDPDSGRFCIPVPKGYTYTCNIGDNARWMNTSGSETITGTAPNTTVEFPLESCPVDDCEVIEDIVFASPILTTTLTWGLAPRDLDSHMLGDGVHVYFAAKDKDPAGKAVSMIEKGSLTADPFIALDTDDVDSYGPEITTVMPSVADGVYCFGVHNFSGEANMSDESTDRNGEATRASIIVQGDGVSETFSIPSSNPDNYMAWKVYKVEFENGRVKSGSFTRIDQMAEYGADLLDCSTW